VYQNDLSTADRAMTPFLMALSLSMPGHAVAPALPRIRADTVPADSTWAPAPSLPLATADTVRKRRKAVTIEYSEWYDTRLTIHRYSSWAMLPIFAGQYYTGRILFDQGTDAPQWVKKAHGPLATGVLVLFTTNTVTGLWNLWEAREDPHGRAWRTAHSVMMLAADAGFTYVGSLGAQAKVNGDVRNRHRTFAIASGSLALASWVMMLKPFRRD
jgi:hypothetical protein